MALPIVLEVFSDYVWPWCYFSTVRTERLRKTYGVQIKWLAFPLHPETPEEGITLKELFAGRNVDVAAIQQRLRAVADTLGLTLFDRSKTYNTRRAQELAKWAESKGRGDEFHDAVFRAYFAKAKNIAGVDELVEIAASTGLQADEARNAIGAVEFRDAVDADWARARSLRVTAVPTFIIGDQMTVGFQSHEVLAQFVEPVIRRITGDGQ
jgi:predicted DsbA family dithiol-disulfide isomerase